LRDTLNVWQNVAASKTLVKLPNALKRSEILDATIVVVRIAEHAHLSELLSANEESRRCLQ
jgi:hypothetical protein